MRPGPALLLSSALALLACNDPSDPAPSDDTGTSSTTAASSSSGADTRGDSTTAALDDTVGTDSATGSTGATGTTSAVDDTSTGGSSSSGPGESSSSEDSGPLPDNGCADGEREAFEDEATLPDIAGCAGGWDVPGVVVNVPYCDRQAGDDALDPLGTGCSVEDLCSEGWHVCADRIEVTDRGIASCNDHAFGGSFFATRQSGNGSDTCAANGVNDVFGCGDIGHTMIVGCAPLNRSTANGCIELPEPWDCDTSLSQEAEFIVKPGPEFGGVICCRD